MLEASAMAKNHYIDWSEVPIIVSVKEAAVVLGVHVNTVKRLIYGGKLVAFKVGSYNKIHKKDLMGYTGLKSDD